jgi:hypothetical protein
MLGIAYRRPITSWDLNIVVVETSGNVHRLDKCVHWASRDVYYVQGCNGRYQIRSKDRASSYGNSISRVVMITHDQRRTAVHAKNNNIDVAVL